MAISILNVIEGMFIDSYKVKASMIEDPLDILARNIRYQTQSTILKSYRVDSWSKRRLDKYGDPVGGTHITKDADRVYTGESVDMPYSEALGFEIASDELHNWGITKEMLSMSDEVKADDINKFAPKIVEKFVAMIREFKMGRREQIRTALKELSTSTSKARLALGTIPIVGEAADRPTYWTYTNELSTALDEDSYRTCVDMFQTQKTIDNYDYGTSRPVMLLHSSSYSLAESIHLPDLSVNQYFRTAGGSLEQKVVAVKAVGIYGDTDHPDDWIALGPDHDISIVAMVDPFNGETEGIFARAYVKDNGNLVFEVRERIEVVINSPIDIVKSVVPSE